MLGGLGNLTGLLKQAKEMQAHMAKLQEELASRRYEGNAGVGMVKSALIDIKIDPQAVGDLEMLEDLIKAAVGAAVAKAQEAMKSELAALTGGLNMPGLNQMLGGGG